MTDAWAYGFCVCCYVQSIHLWQINFSRSPYPMFGLTASAGNPVRPSLLEVRSDKIARLRLDLELVYNSVAGRSTDDNVDSHGSPHGTVRGAGEEGGGMEGLFCR